jgi:hypothetical protein
VGFVVEKGLLGHVFSDPYDSIVSTVTSCGQDDQGAKF